MGKVRNTTRDVRENPADFFAVAMGLGSSFAIEHQESQGQQQLVNLDLIPTRILDGNDSQLAAVGFTLGETVSDDPMFRKCTLPKGWKKKGSDHDMWSYIHDEKDRSRISIFYKAAFYDRDAHLRLSCRYHTDAKYATGEALNTATNDYGKATHKIYCVVDFDGTVLFSVPGVGKEAWDEQDAARKQADQWLKDNFPDNRNPAAYW